MDIWQRIENDHANIGDLIHEMPGALPDGRVLRSRPRLLGDLIDAVDLHGAAVSASLFPPLRRDRQCARLIAELERDHARTMRDLRTLARGGSGRSGWLSRFEDVSYALDQALHLHRHELIPAARGLLSPREVEEAGRAYVQARMRVLRARRAGLTGLAGDGALATAGAVTLAAALGLLVWRLNAPRRRAVVDTGRLKGFAAGKPHADRAAASAPGQRHPGEDLRERQERLLDEAIEETFPASDPIAPKRITR